MTYSVKEVFYSLQGEGFHSGRPAVFCRFAGCNLWTGREEDRATAVCSFCDTDFIGVDGEGGGKFKSARGLAEHVRGFWPGGRGFVVCTGGEPFLQLDQALVDAFHECDFEVAVETNGTIVPRCQPDWVCVSPKRDAKLVIRRGDELKLVYPQEEAMPEHFTSLEFDHFSLQPMDGPQLDENVKSSLAYCLSDPRWRLSLQTHKLLGLR